MYIFRKRSKLQNTLSKKGKVCPECNSSKMELTAPGRDRTTFTCQKCGFISIFTKGPESQQPEVKKKEYSLLQVREKPIPADKVTARFKSFDKETLSARVDVLRTAMQDKMIVSFHYASAKGKSFRTVEPYKLTLKGNDLVLFAHDLEGDGIRVFKIDKMAGVEQQEYAFEPRHQIEDKLKDDASDEPTAQDSS